MTRILVLLTALFASGNAFADRWIPYTDGRVGGCFLNDAGVLYGCTPQPSQAQPAQGSTDSSGEYLERRRSSDRELQLETENAQLRAQQDAISRQVRARQARQEAEARAISDYYEEQNRQQFVQESKARESQWHEERRCDAEEYDRFLEEQSLKRHPSVRGICVRPGWKGSADIQEACPPCK